MGKALVVGLGMGQLYAKVLADLGYTVETADIDSSKNPTHTSLSTAVGPYAVTVVCVPNHAHERVARTVAARSAIVLVEKPGVSDHVKWLDLVNEFSGTRIAMIKNNQYRDSIDEFQQLVDVNIDIQVVWHNKNRVPSPGSWFTDKSKSFGGVSRDLIPHMLSYYCKLADHRIGNRLSAVAEQRHQLKDITSTDYGTVNKFGTYDVDDFCELVFENAGKTWRLSANWKTDSDTDISINFGNTRIELDLCPEEAYATMITTAVSNIDNEEFWEDQLEQDVWIHQQIEQL